MERTTQLPKPEIARVAQIVQTSYIRHRRRFDQQLAEEDPDFEPRPILDCPQSGALIWRDIAKMLLFNQMDPYRYVTAQFEDWPSIVPPGPPFLLTQHAKNRYYPMNRASDRLEVTLRVQRAYAESEMFRFQMECDCTDTEALIVVVGCRSGTLSALYRFCSMIACPDPEAQQIAKDIRDAAMDQLLDDPQRYRMFWHEILPPSWMEKVPGEF